MNSENLAAISDICSLSVSTSNVQGFDMWSLLNIGSRNLWNRCLMLRVTAHLYHWDCIGDLEKAFPLTGDSSLVKYCTFLEPSE